MTLIQFVQLAFLGLGVGTLAGLFGVGGGFLITPLLRLLGVDFTVAVGSSLCSIIGTSILGVREHANHGNINWKYIGMIGVGMVGGTLAGAWIHRLLRAWLTIGGDEAPFDLAMIGLYVFTLASISIIMTQTTTNSPVDGLKPEFPALTRRLMGQLAGLGAAVGVVSGLLGLGGGVLIVPGLVIALNFDSRLAVGTSLGAVFISAIAGTATYAWSGHVDLWIAGAILVGSSVGVRFGTYLCNKVSGKKFRHYFVLFIFLVICMLVRKGASIIGHFAGGGLPL